MGDIEHFDAFTNFFTGKGPGSISGGFDSMLEPIKKAFEPLEMIGGFFKQIAKFFETVWKDIWKIIQFFFNILLGLIDSIDTIIKKGPKVYKILIVIILLLFIGPQYILRILTGLQDPIPKVFLLAFSLYVSTTLLKKYFDELKKAQEYLPISMVTVLVLLIVSYIARNSNRL